LKEMKKIDKILEISLENIKKQIQIVIRNDRKPFLFVSFRYLTRQFAWNIMATEKSKFH